MTNTEQELMVKALYQAMAVVKERSLSHMTIPITIRLGSCDQKVVARWSFTYRTQANGSVDTAD